MASAIQDEVRQQPRQSPHGQAHLEAEQQQAFGDEASERNQRVAYLLGGSFLTLLGLRRRSTFGAVLAVAGGSLIYKGMMMGCEQRGE